MPNFKYSAKSNEGKTINGTMEASSPSEVVGELRKKNLTILNIREVNDAIGSGRKLFQLGKAKPGKPRGDELCVFTRQLATMIGAGITLLDSLEVLSEQAEQPRFSATLRVVTADIRSGIDLSKALAKHPKSFPSLYVNMVRAGEVSGQLDEILVRIADYLEAASRLRREIKSAMAYPIVSLVLVLGITIFLLGGIVPKFKPIFESLPNVKMPKLTQIVLNMSSWMETNWYMVIVGVVGTVLLLGILKRTKRGSYVVDYSLLKMPIFGPLFRKVALSRFSRTFSTLLKSGVPILGSLEIVADTAGNQVIGDALLKARESVRNGNTLSDPLADSPLFPPMVTRMIGIGERSGSLEQLLEKISMFYDEQVTAQVKGLTSLIEPLLIGVMGFFVGGIVLAVFLPIFEIQKSLAGGG
ncbi:MAG: type II secretion system F family protein [Planctomycetota bacterium]